MIALTLAALLAQADGGQAPYRAAEPALRASFELVDGGVVMLPSAPDAGIVAVVLTPERAIELANERQQLAHQLESEKRLRAAEAAKLHPATVVGFVLATLQLTFNAVPIIIEAARRRP